MVSAIIFQSQSILIFSLLCLGLFLRKQPSKHVPIMRTVIIWDILLILQIELNRKAILKASKVLTNHWLLNFHVTIAVITVILYLLLYLSGKQKLEGKNKKNFHKYFGQIAFILRTLTLITSFFIVLDHH